MGKAELPHDLSWLCGFFFCRVGHVVPCLLLALIFSCASSRQNLSPAAAARQIVPGMDASGVRERWGEPFNVYSSRSPAARPETVWTYQRPEGAQIGVYAVHMTDGFVTAVERTSQRPRVIDPDNYRAYPGQGPQFPG